MLSGANDQDLHAVEATQHQQSDWVDDSMYSSICVAAVIVHVPLLDSDKCKCSALILCVVLWTSSEAVQAFIDIG